MATPEPPTPADPSAAGVGRSHYERLEVASTASDLELRQAFRNLSKRYHPDTTKLPLEQAQQAFRLLQEAYGVLSDPLDRRRYDTQLRQARLGQASPAKPPPGPAAGPRQAAPKPLGVRRALSGGEWFALLLLGLALVLSLVLGLGVAWARGTALVRSPSWWPDPSSAGSASSPAATPNPALPPLVPNPSVPPFAPTPSVPPLAPTPFADARPAA